MSEVSCEIDEDGDVRFDVYRDKHNNCTVIINHYGASWASIVDGQASSGDDFDGLRAALEAAFTKEQAK